MGDHAYCYPGFDLTEAPGDIVGPAPCVGADNDVVFRDLMRLSEAEYRACRDEGVFD
jgi:benzylsuccinate CoA-transferase BbsF subunit